jgi:hypothetical protein
LTIQFVDSRAMPISVPSTVAAMMPTTATRSVLSSPSTRASRTGALCDSEFPVIWNAAGLSRKSKLVGMFCREAFSV